MKRVLNIYIIFKNDSIEMYLYINMIHRKMMNGDQSSVLCAYIGQFEIAHW